MIDKGSLSALVLTPSSLRNSLANFAKAWHHNNFSKVICGHIGAFWVASTEEKPITDLPEQGKTVIERQLPD
jgi:hypothetical protein